LLGCDFLLLVGVDNVQHTVYYESHAGRNTTQKGIQMNATTTATALPKILQDAPSGCLSVLAVYWPLLRPSDRAKISDYTCQTWALIAFERAMDKVAQADVN